MAEASTAAILSRLARSEHVHTMPMLCSCNLHLLFPCSNPLSKPVHIFQTLDTLFHILLVAPGTVLYCASLIASQARIH